MMMHVQYKRSLQLPVGLLRVRHVSASSNPQQAFHPKDRRFVNERCYKCAWKLMMKPIIWMRFTHLTWNSKIPLSHWKFNISQNEISEKRYLTLSYSAMSGIHIRTTSTGTNASTIGPNFCVTSKHRNGPCAAGVIWGTTKSAASSAACDTAAKAEIPRKARCEPALCEVLSTPFGAGVDSESADGCVRRSRPTRVRAAEPTDACCGADRRVWRSQPDAARLSTWTEQCRLGGTTTDRQTDRNRAGAAGGRRGPLPPRGSPCAPHHNGPSQVTASPAVTASQVAASPQV